MVQKTPNSKVSPHQHQQKIITLCSEEEFLEIPQGQFLNGVNNGLYLTIDSEVFESSYDDEFSLSTGSLMTLSYPFTRPIVKQRGWCKTLLTSLGPKLLIELEPFVHKTDTLRLDHLSYFQFSGVYVSPGSEFLFPFRSYLHKNQYETNLN